jgi:hypothetical protein
MKNEFLARVDAWLRCVCPNQIVLKSMSFNLTCVDLFHDFSKSSW